MSSDSTFEGRLAVPDEARTLLASYRDLCREAVLDRLPSKEPRRYLYDLLPRYPSRPGKGLRPALCLAAGRVFGGSLTELLPCAVALELLHTSFLIHDDIQDESSCRRGEPALHVQEGVAMALNAGNALATLAVSELIRGVAPLGSRLTLDVLLDFDRMVRETIEGQATDLGWERDNVTELTVADYLRMSLKKTGWYTGIGPLRLGALVGSRGRASIDWTLRLGYFLGVMFQINDDLASLTQQDGYNATNGDVYDGKRTLMLIHLLTRMTGHGRTRLVRFLDLPREKRLPQDVEWILDQMGKHGSIAFARSCMRGMAGAAMWEADAAFGRLPESPDKALLLATVPLLLEITT